MIIKANLREMLALLDFLEKYGELGEQLLKETDLVYGNCVKCGRADYLHPEKKLCVNCFFGKEG